MMVVVYVKVTSTDKMSEAFKEKDDKYRVWATHETREMKVVKVVMVPLIVSHDGAVHRDTVKRWKNFGELFSPSNQNVPGFLFPSLEEQKLISFSTSRNFTEGPLIQVEGSRTLSF